MSMSMSIVKDTYYIKNKMLLQGHQGYLLRGLSNEICLDRQDEYQCIREGLLTFEPETSGPVVTIKIEGFSYQLMALSLLLKEI